MSTRLVTDTHYRRGYWMGSIAALSAGLAMLSPFIAFAILSDWMPLWWRVLALVCWPTVALYVFAKMIVVEIVARLVA